MSGPKIDTVELERRRKEELERQRQERLKRIREETEKLNKEVLRAKAKLNDIAQHIMSLVSSIDKAGEMASVVKKLNELRRDYQKKFDKLLALHIPVEPEAIANYTQGIAYDANGLVGSYTREIKPFDERIKNYLGEIETLRKRKEASKKLSGKRVQMLPVQDFDFSARMKNIANAELELPVSERATQILAEIEEMVNSESIQDADMQALLKIGANVYQTAFETMTSFEAAAIEYNVRRPAILRNMVIFDDAYQDYLAEHIVYLGVLYEDRAVPPEDMPIEKQYFASIEDVNKEAELFAQVAKAEKERRYIREQIDDVMRLYGYDLSEEIVFDANQTGDHFVCEAEAGQSGIHIYLSNKNQMMMEVVRIGESADTEPVGTANGLVAASADASLLEEQVRFCELHPRIVAELRRRSVIMNEKSRKPPGLEYGKKITRFTKDSDVMAASSGFISERVNKRRAKTGIKQQLRAMQLKEN